MVRKGEWDVYCHCSQRIFKTCFVNSNPDLNFRNTNALHAWTGFQLNTILQNSTNFLTDISLNFSILAFLPAYSIQSRKANCQDLGGFNFRCNRAVTYAAHSKFRCSPSGTGTGHPYTCRHSCTWCCTVVLQQSTGRDIPALSKNITLGSKCEQNQRHLKVDTSFVQHRLWA